MGRPEAPGPDGQLAAAGRGRGPVPRHAVFTLTNQIAGEEAFNNGAWRIPFLLSIVLVAIGLFVRLQILETPMFAAVVAENRVEKAPIAQVLVHHWSEVVLSALLRMSEQMPFYVVTTFVLAYMVDDNGYSKNFVLVGTLIAAGIELVLVPTFGHLSDTIGRKRIYMTAAAVMGVWGFVYFAPARQRGRLAGVPRDLPRAGAARDAVRPAGGADRRELPRPRCGTAAPGWATSWPRSSPAAPRRWSRRTCIHQFGTPYAIAGYIRSRP